MFSKEKTGYKEREVETATVQDFYGLSSGAE